MEKRPVRAWQRIGRRSRFRHALFEVFEDEVAADTEAGPPDTRRVVVIDPPAWVNVVALLNESVDGDSNGRGQDVLMVRQWRHGVGQPTLEIPGGMVEPDESDEVAASRELLEETGYRAGRLHRLGVLHPNPAFMTNRVSTWLATELERVHGADSIGVDGEELGLERVPLTSISGLVASERITHSLVVAAFHLFDLHAPSLDLNRSGLDRGGSDRDGSK